MAKRFDNQIVLGKPADRARFMYTCNYSVLNRWRDTYGYKTNEDTRRSYGCSWDVVNGDPQMGLRGRAGHEML
jgi:hypothetical protein